MLVALCVSVLLLLSACLVRWYAGVRGRMKYWKKLPSRPGRFLWGNAYDLISVYTRKSKYHPGVYLLNQFLGGSVLHAKEGLYAFWLGPTPFVTVFCPEVAEKLLSSSVSLEKSFEYAFFRKWLGLGLVTSTGSHWRSHRKLLTPCFHFRILEDFLSSFHEQAQVLVAKIAEKGDEPVDVAPLMTLCTLDIVCETVMGARIGAQTGKNCEYTTAVRNLGDLFNQRSCRPWLTSDFLFSLTDIGRRFDADLDVIHAFTRNVIRQKKREGSRRQEAEEGGGRRRRALMDLLLDFGEKGNLTEEEILDEVETFMFAGHETTAMALTYGLYCIGLYPDVQRRVVEELDAVFPDVTLPPCMEDLKRLKYLECVLKESQRIYPTVPLVGRKTAEDITHKGMVIPAGTEIHLNILSLHRRPDSFPDPEKFDPDRFLPDSPERHPYAYVPFSAGPRNCIGQKFALLEMKVTLASILRRFRVESLDPRDRLFVKIEFTLKPAEPVRLRFIPRSQTSTTTTN